MNKKYIILEPLSQQDLERFWSKVDKTENCWLWQAGKRRRGYGRFWLKGKSVVASRVAFFIETNIDPTTNLVCHTCDNPTCVKPVHLFQGTALDNMHDMITKGRQRIPIMRRHYGDDHWSHKKPERVMRGQKTYKGIFTADDIRAIRLERFNGDSPKVIAAKRNIARITVYHILSGRHYKWVV